MENRPLQGKKSDEAAGRQKPAHRGLVLLLLVAVTVGLLAPIWTVRYVPLVDYPNHLASAFVLAHLHDPAYHFGKFYGGDWGAYPYLLMEWILLGLQWVAPIGAAGRILLSLMVLAVPAASWFFLTRANPGEENLAWWSLLMAANLYFFLYAFINTQFSLALCLVVVGAWIGYLERPRAAPYAGLLALTTLLYFTHLLGFGMAGFVMTVYALLTRRGWRRLLLTWLLFLPGGLLYLTSRVHTSGAGGWAVVYQGVGRKLMGLLAIVSAVSPAVDFLTLVTLLVCLGLAWADNREFRWNRAWLGVTAMIFVLYLLFPAGYGSGLNADRQILPFAFLFGLAAIKVGRRGRRLAAIALVLFAIRTVALERHFLSEQPRLEQMARAFTIIPAGARVVPLIGWQEEAKPSALRGFWPYGVIERGWLSPGLFHNPGVQPLALHAGVYDPYQAPSYEKAQVMDWNRVAAEYDFVWAYRAPKFADPPAGIASPAFQSDGLTVYRLHPAASAGR